MTTAFPRHQTLLPIGVDVLGTKLAGDLREGNLGRGAKPRKCQLQAQLQAASASSSRKTRCMRNAQKALGRMLQVRVWIPDPALLPALCLGARIHQMEKEWGTYSLRLTSRKTLPYHQTPTGWANHSPPRAAGRGAA